VSLNKIVIFFPNFARGGIEKVSLLLTSYLLNQKIQIIFISFEKLNSNFINNNKLFKNINILYVKNVFLKFLFSMISLTKVLLNSDKKNTVVLSFQNSIIAVVVSKIMGFKVAIRNSAPIDYYKVRSYYSGSIILIIKVLIYKFADLIISNSINTAKKIKLFPFLRKKVIIISNPMQFENKNNNFKKKRKNIILYVGRLSYEKGVDKLIDGFELFLKKKPLFKLLIIGSGIEKNKLLKKVKEKKLLKKIIFKNWIFNLEKYYLTSKILVLPSYFEGLSNVIIESLNYKLPCVATDTDGPTEILKKGKYGLIIKSNNKKDISEGLLSVIENYQIYRHKALLGFNSNKKYSLQNIGPKYLDAIRFMLN
jgi:glycosyltransferase involved in cell wall biosynthesis